MNIQFLVQGIPKPAGSKRAFIVKSKRDGKPFAVVTDANPASKDWKTTVSIEAKRAMQGLPPLQGPIYLKLIFCLQRPKAHFGSGKQFSVLRQSAPPHPIGKPDVLKLARGVEDALTGILYQDDAQIVEEHLFKKYTQFSDTQGVIIEAMTIDPASFAKIRHQVQVDEPPPMPPALHRVPSTQDVVNSGLASEDQAAARIVMQKHGLIEDHSKALAQINDIAGALQLLQSDC